MEIFGDAYFVERPRTIRDLRVPHPLEKRRPFKIVKTIELSAIDYENFIFDLLADRSFIEAHHSLCSKGEVWDCLYICKRKSKEGILVLPYGKCYVDWAAFYSL